MFVTREDLINLEACELDIDRFTEEWPNGVEVTEDNLRRAFKIGLDVNWWAGELFGESYQAAKKPLWEAYEAAERPLWEAYKAGERPLWEAYKAGERPLSEAYEAGQIQLILQLANNNNNNTKET